MSGQFLRYIIVGAWNTLLGYGAILFFLFLFNFTAVWANLFGYLIGIISSFILNKFVVFQSERWSLREAFLFFSIFLGAYGINLLVLNYLLALGVRVEFSQLFAIIIYTLVSYQLNFWLTFRIKPD
jgi:putative flippase GtrA